MAPLATRNIPFMTTSRFTVRLDAEERTADLEITTPHSRPKLEGLERSLRRLGIRFVHTFELSTSKYRITRAKLVDVAGSKLNASRVMQILSTVQPPPYAYSSWHSVRAA
jgi:hypothetical protein